MISLLEYLNSIHPLSVELRRHLQSIIKRKELSRKEYLLKEGQVCRNIYFVEQGLLRGFYVRDGTEISSWFGKRNDLCISVESFFKQQPCKESIQALEDAVLYYIEYYDLQRTYRNFPPFNFNLRVLMEKNYQFSEQKLAAMRLQRSHERYAWLMKYSPELIQRVAARYLASYLGITEVTLSVIKGRR